MDITVNTKWIPVIGKPLEQSLSAQMGNWIYESQGLDYRRFPIEVEREDLPAVLGGLRCMNVSAIGVTKPYKVEVMQYLDEIDELAEKIGAVNSILVKERRLIGRNVDGKAFLRALMRHTDRPLSEMTFFCIGAGGAGRAICCTLADAGAGGILAADLREEAADSLVRDIREKFSYPAAERILLPQAVKAARRADVLINATGLGMRPGLEETPVPADIFEPRHLVFDAAYNPPRTRFLRDAEAAGCRVFNGKDMIIGCGMIGYEERTGKTLEYSVWSGIFDRLLAETEKKERKEEGKRE